jgi:cytochrome c oxidase assembly factor CtaG
MRALSFLGVVLPGVLVLAPAVCHAHAGGHDAAAWTFEPGVVLPLLAALFAYAIGSHRLARRSARGWLTRRPGRGWFALGWSVLALALVSPLHAGGEHSFALHMAEHELLMLVAAPLLVLARPLGTLLWALPRAARAVVGRWSRGRAVTGAWHALTGPVTATALQAVALWAWHAPRPFGLALASEGWHVLQHLSFLITALLFWTAMFDRRRMQRHAAVVIGCLFATATVSGALGALMAFSSSPWYAGYAALGMTPLGLTPAEDQQVAGLLMWIPGGLVHAGAALAILARTLRQPRRGRQPWPGITG